MTRRAVVAILAALMVVTLPSTALGAVSIRTQGTTSWSPARVRVAPRTRIVWRATSGTHTVTSYGGGWTFDQRISAGADPTVSKLFRRTGTFRFRCRFHSSLFNGVCSGMCGRVRVTA